MPPKWRSQNRKVSLTLAFAKHRSKHILPALWKPPSFSYALAAIAASHRVVDAAKVAVA